MKKAVLTGINKIELTEAPIPEIINEDDVLIQMKVVGVCGSDIHYYTSGRIGSQEVEYPFTVGHEGAGVVSAVGGKVTKVKPGDRIAVEPSVACGKCDQCLNGRPHTCRNIMFLGCPGQLEGNLAEYMVMPEDQCIKLEDSQAIEDGALSEPLAIGLYAVKLAELQPGAKIGILGYGPIGFSVMSMAKAYGIEKIYVSEKIEERCQMAKEQGTTAVFNPLHQHVEAEISKSEPLLLDVVFECCGQQDAMDTAIHSLKPGGKLIVIGIPEFDNWTFKADIARRHELSIIHARRQNHCADETLELMAQGKVDGAKMMTHHYNLDDVSDAFELVKNYKDGVMKAMIHF